MSAAKREPAKRVTGKRDRGRTPGRDAARGAGASRNAKTQRGNAPEADRRGRSMADLATGVGRFALWALVVVPPFLISATAEDSFRLPKLAAAESLALLSMIALAASWWSRRGLSLADLARRPATVFAALLAAAVLPGAFAAVHPLHWQRATTSLVLALGCLVIWSARLDQAALRRALALLGVPAAGLAVLAILQAHGIFNPFEFSQGVGNRYGITSLAGSVGDLGAYLILPALVLQAGLARGGRRVGQAVRGVLLVLIAYALFLSQTLAALAAVGAATLVLWAVLLPRRRRAWVAASVAVAAGASLFVPGLAWRLEDKLEQLRELDLESLLTGRPDAWKAALEMFREHPWLGVGHGGYGSSFAAAKLALVERGVEFWSRGRYSHYVNAHSEYLEALAEWGLWGMAALAGAVVVLIRRLYSLWHTATPTDRALAVSGTIAFAVLALASFPLRMALTGYPWVLFAAWVFAAPAPARGTAVAGAEPESETASSGRVVVPAWTLSAALLLLLVPTLVLHARASSGRLEASRIVRTTSEVAQLAMRGGTEAARPVLQANLPPLRRAALLDPLDVGVPMATGSHYLLLGNGAAAIEGYERGMQIEPRATLYLNLGRALLVEGRRDEGMARIDDAISLDPGLAEEAARLGWIDRRPEDDRHRLIDRSRKKDRARDGVRGDGVRGDGVRGDGVRGRRR